VKSRRLLWAENVVLMGRWREKCAQNLCGKNSWSGHLENLEINGRITLR
jgi:hypothetical protein